MPRLSIHSERVQQLIAGRVIPLLLASGSVAALTNELNEALRAAGESGTLHPNRLHALLSEDSTRALNEGTVELTERAASLAWIKEPEWRSKADAALDALRTEAARLQQFSSAGSREIAERLEIPAALATRLSREVAPPSHHEAGTPVVSLRAPTEPDWSYQDTAVARTLEAFGRRPSGRIGLILPTGAGKTRTALRIVLAMLKRAGDPKTLAYWITHRRNLREQALRELQKLIASQQVETGDAQLTAELANRIRFVMVGDLSPLLDGAAAKPALIVVDEAHHAAAPSYQPVIANPWSAPVLLLTATPNRSDQLPIGIDEIAFTITYRELAERRAVLTPKFLDFPVEDFDWSTDEVSDLVDYLADRTSTEFTKVLVLAPRIDRVEEFYRLMLDRWPDDHPIEIEDIGFVHGSGNSLGVGNEDFLARFANKPRAIIVSAQLLLEGFDDPGINAVVITYPSSSIIRVMQAAGRCVRYAPGKTAAYVVQARNDHLAYHFDQRWLYQEIDDFLHPRLLDIDYGTHSELMAKCAELLHHHHVEPGAARRMLARLESLRPGDACRIFLYGLPYFGAAEDFGTTARWGGVLETTEMSESTRGIFNAFCALGADLSDPTDFLLREGMKHGITKDLVTGSRWMEFMGLLTASYFAKREVHGPAPLEATKSRPYRQHGATTWLTYVTFNYRPAVPATLSAFLHDCHNAEQIEIAYLERPLDHVSAVKVPLPLGGSEAFLLDDASNRELDDALSQLKSELAQAEPQRQFSVLGGFVAGASFKTLPSRLLGRSEFLLSSKDRLDRVLTLQQIPKDAA